MEARPRITGGRASAFPAAAFPGASSRAPGRSPVIRPGRRRGFPQTVVRG
ncbi:hypothetical protein FHS01_001748 [Longimicrobium terrae]|uniref:Uncharacterized protein n=1 Tax=Longimicrobium terrae TaxID=1639882 RepID=A0A841GSA4_9BACT|nr:hypothetical protein [Longimicrobium terrae]MBB6070130.1 hypothetical protein [Longimicrobium terrae]